MSDVDVPGDRAHEPIELSPQLRAEFESFTHFRTTDISLARKGAKVTLVTAQWRYRDSPFKFRGGESLGCIVEVAEGNVASVDSFCEAVENSSSVMAGVLFASALGV